MTRKLLLALFFVGITTMSFAQDELNITLSGGVPMGTKVKEVSDMAFEGDVNYLFDMYDGIKAGPSLSFLYFNPKEDQDALMYLPLGGTIKFMSTNDSFFVGTDLGVVLPVLDDSKKTGVYFKPYVGYNISEAFKVAVSYSAVEMIDEYKDSGYIGLNLILNVL